MSPRWPRVFTIIFRIQATFTFGLVATAGAGPCTKEIEAVQLQVDAVLEATASAGPTLPESQSARLHHEPTPESIARAEQQAGDGPQEVQALAALARAREADQAGDAHLATPHSSTHGGQLGARLDVGIHQDAHRHANTAPITWKSGVGRNASCRPLVRTSRDGVELTTANAKTDPIRSLLLHDGNVVA